MKIKSVFFITIFVFTLFAAAYFMTVRVCDYTEKSDDSKVPDYDLNDLGWDEIVEKGKEEGSVSFATWWADAYFNRVAALFEEKYGIKVEVVIQDIDTITHKIILEKERSRGSLDIYFAGFIGHVRTVLDENLLLEGVKRIPDWGKLMEKERMYHKNLYAENLMIPLYRNQVAFLYNPEKVPVPPRSWDDFNLWIADNPGKFVFSALKGGSGEAFKHTVLYHLTGGSDKYRTGSHVPVPELISKWDMVWDWFISNKNNYGLTGSNHDSISRIQSGDAWITPAFVDDTQIAIKSGLLDPEMKLYIPDFGLFKGDDGAGILANAPHKAAAMLFLSFLVSKDIQLLMLDEIGSDSIRNDIENPDNPLLSAEERRHGISHTDPVYYLYFASEFQKNVLGK